jgi:dihydroxy-acid dehydratase
LRSEGQRHFAGLRPRLRDGAFEARAIVFDGADDYHARINDPCCASMKTSSSLRAGPMGWPGSAEVVNMQPTR